jgi:hypothetical protein
LFLAARCLLVLICWRQPATRWRLRPDECRAPPAPGAA